MLSNKFSYKKIAFFVGVLATTLVNEGALADDEAEKGIPYTHHNKPKLAVIIDDLGYDLERGDRVLNLPGAITISVLPFTPHAKELAARAITLGKEVLLHQPLESQKDKHEAKGTLKLSMSAFELQRNFRKSIQSVPGIVGVNNHTGSRFTENIKLMSVLMEVMSQHQLFFVDSRTTADGVAVDAAHRIGVPVAQRDVFLDHKVNTEEFERAFLSAWNIAKNRGYAILVAHPHEKSIRFLARNLKLLGPNTLVPVSKLVNSARLTNVVRLENQEFAHR